MNKAGNNAGRFRWRIKIYSVKKVTDSAGFKSEEPTLIATPHAEVKTTSGFTMIANNSDFENAETRFTIRYSKKISEEYEKNNRRLVVVFRNRDYSVDYLNNKDEECKEIEIQAKAVTK